MFYILIRMTGAFLFSIMNILAVSLGFIWSMVFFSEAHSLFVWIAMALMLSGVLLITLQPGRAGAAVQD